MTGTKQESADGAGAEQQYYLVFPGNVLPGSNYDQSITYLADLLKTSLYKAKKLVSGKKRYIKRKFSRRHAETLRDQVLELGVACELKVAREKDSPEKSAMQPGQSTQTEAINRQQTLPTEAEPAEHQLAGEQLATAKTYSETMNELQAIADGLRKAKATK